MLTVYILVQCFEWSCSERVAMVKLMPFSFKYNYYMLYLVYNQSKRITIEM